MPGEKSPCTNAVGMGHKCSFKVKNHPIVFFDSSGNIISALNPTFVKSPGPPTVIAV